MKIKTANLTGVPLDWTVDQILFPKKTHTQWVSKNYRRYSTLCAHGGPIIDQEGIGTLFDSGSACRAPSWFATPDDQCTTSSHEGESFDPTFMVNESAGMRGPTRLIAAMRCFVAYKLGDEVDIPEVML